jgi:hypothetical protein
MIATNGRIDRRFRTPSDAMRCPATAIAAVSASMSPRNAVPESLKSNPVMSTAPPSAMPIPTAAARRRRSFRKRRASTADHTGWVDTSTVLAATVVRLTDGIQKLKCTASSAPAPQSARTSPRRSDLSSERWRPSARGRSTAVANRFRYMATASGGASSARRMSGAAKDTTTTPSARRTPCRALIEAGLAPRPS